jgi:hypothetical protein
MSRPVTHGRELRPNTSFNRTPFGGLPQGAGQLERNTARSPSEVPVVKAP